MPDHIGRGYGNSECKKGIKAVDKCPHCDMTRHPRTEWLECIIANAFNGYFAVLSFILRVQP